MKKLIYGIFLVVASSCVFGQARLGAYPWSITLKVVDDNGNPVEGAKAWVSYGSPKKGESVDPFHPNTWAVAVLTDTSGNFCASRTNRSWGLGIFIQKNGYYSDYINYMLFLPGQFDDQKVATNRTTSMELTLKKIIKPIPMYAKSLNTYIPDLDKLIGYDFEAGDWVGRYGTGTNADILFAAHFYKYTNSESDFTLTISFPNPGDGIQEFTAPVYYLHSRGSDLLSMQKAPENGYKSGWVQVDDRVSGKPVNPVCANLSVSISGQHDTSTPFCQPPPMMNATYIANAPSWFGWNGQLADHLFLVLSQNPVHPVHPVDNQKLPNEPKTPASLLAFSKKTNPNKPKFAAVNWLSAIEHGLFCPKNLRISAPALRDADSTSACVARSNVKLREVTFKAPASTPSKII